jgi:LemA protein
MRKTLIIVGVVLVAVFLLYRLFVGTYNNMVEKDVKVQNAWAQVENVYQRRLDLIPNLVSTVKGAAEFEKSTLTAVIEARANATQIKVDASKLNAEQIAKFQEAQGSLSTALGRLMVVAENYPALKANQNFLDLQVQLEGTENRITEERRKFNEEVQSFNAYIRKFPQVMLAGMYGFQNKAFFAAENGAEKAPKVEF